MGSGKTTLGRKLANKLNQPFFDLDAEIERLEGEVVSGIFEKNGENYFRKVESEVLRKIINEHASFVMAVGGGTPCHCNNMEMINQSGTSIYLKYNAGILTSRLINAKTKRPLIKNLNEEELIVFVENKLVERELFYEQSNFVVEKTNIKVENLWFFL